MWGSPVIALAIVAAVAGLGAFVLLERRSARPILPLRLFADRTFSSTASAALLYAGAFFGSVLAFSLDFQDVRGDSPAVAGLYIGAITVSFGLTSVVAGRLAARYGTRGPILAGLLALSVSAWWAAELSPLAPFPAHVYDLCERGELPHYRDIQNSIMFDARHSGSFSARDARTRNNGAPPRAAAVHGLPP